LHVYPDQFCPKTTMEARDETRGFGEKRDVVWT